LRGNRNASGALDLAARNGWTGSSATSSSSLREFRAVVDHSGPTATGTGQTSSTTSTNTALTRNRPLQERPAPRRPASVRSWNHEPVHRRLARRPTRTNPRPREATIHQHHTRHERAGIDSAGLLGTGAWRAEGGGGPGGGGGGERVFRFLAGAAEVPNPHSREERRDLAEFDRHIQATVWTITKPPWLTGCRCQEIESGPGTAEEAHRPTGQSAAKRLGKGAARSKNG